MDRMELNAALGCEFPQCEQASLSPLPQFPAINSDQCGAPQMHTIDLASIVMITQVDPNDNRKAADRIVLTRETGTPAFIRSLMRGGYRLRRSRASSRTTRFLDSG